MGRPEEGSVDDRHALRRHGDLSAPGRRPGELPRCRSGPQPERSSRTESRAQAGAERRTEPGQPPIAECPHADPVDAPGASDHLDERVDAGVVLGVDVEADVGPGSEQILEQRNRFPTVDPGGVDLLASDDVAIAPARSVTRSR